MTPRKRGRKAITQVPEGYARFSQAVKLFYPFDENSFSYRVRAGDIAYHADEHGKMYEIASVLRVKTALLAEVQAKNAVFSRATLTDMEGVVKLASKIFHNVVPVINRQQWIFKEPHGHYVIKLADGTVIAYAHILALPLSTIELHMRHELKQQDINIADVQSFEAGHHYDTLLVAIGVDPAIKEQKRRAAFSSVLLRGISEDLAELGKEGIIIDHLYAWADTNEGILLCAKMGMQQWAPPVKLSETERRRYSFVLDVLNSPIPLLQPYIMSIRKWLEEHSA